MERATARTALHYCIILSLALLVGLSLYGTPLPGPKDVVDEVLRGAPVQTNATDSVPFGGTVGAYKYTFTPHASYVLPGLVVSLHHSDSWIDISHKGDPAQTVDICVVWGPNISTNGYRMVTYDHGDWTCYYRWSTEYDPPFSGNFLSNTHLIPTTPELAQLIKSIKVGDQILMKGELVDYAIEGADGPSGSRNTSLVRTDTGNGACEILLVSDVTILRRNMPWRDPLWDILLALVVLGVIGEFYLSMPARSVIAPTSPPDEEPDPKNPFDARNFMKHEE